MVLTGLEVSVWLGTARQLAEEQVGRHISGVRAEERYLLGLLMDDGKSCRSGW